MISRLLPSEPKEPAARTCLEFVFLNTLTWQTVIGTPLVLFATQLGGDSTAIGLLSSFVLLLTPVQVLSTSLLSRWGYKRLMLSGWGSRSLLLVIPVGLALAAGLGGPRPWMVGVLGVSVFLFCLFRAIGLAANVPWFYAVIPPSLRGVYFSSESVSTGVASILTLVTSALTFALLPVYTAVVVQYGIAATSSAWSWFTLRRLPDGPRPQTSGVRDSLRALPSLLFSATPYSRYLRTSVWVWIITSPLPVFFAFYLKATRGLPSGWIMVLEMVRYAGSMAAGSLIRRRISHVGARPYLLLSMALYFVVSVLWLLYSRMGYFTLVPVCYLLLGGAGTCWTVGHANFLPKLPRAGEVNLMISVYGAMTALAGGLSAVVWGRLFRTGSGVVGVDEVWFSAFFAFAAVVACVLSVLLSRHEEVDAEQADALIVLNALGNPWRAARYVAVLASKQDEVTGPEQSTEAAPERVVPRQ